MADAHSGVAKDLREKYPTVKRQLGVVLISIVIGYCIGNLTMIRMLYCVIADVWHVLKGVQKDLATCHKLKGHELIVYWQESIIKFMWIAVDMASRSSGYGYSGDGVCCSRSGTWRR